MTVDFGTDLGLVLVDGAYDMPPQFPLVTGFPLLAAALLRRFSTPNGKGLMGRRHPTYAYDLRALLSEEFTPRTFVQARAAIIVQAEQDPRVLLATAAIDLDAATKTLTVTLALQTAAGPFQLVLRATPDVVTLLKAPNV